MITVMAKKKNPARSMREMKNGRSDRNLAGRTPTRTAPAYRSSPDVGPGFDSYTGETGSGYGMTQEEQNTQNYPNIARRMFEAQSLAEREIPFAGRSPQDFQEQYVPNYPKRGKVDRILDQFGTIY